MAHIEVDRGQVMAYRAWAHQLHRVAASPAQLAVLDLGVQESTPGSARIALAARTTAALDDDTLVPVWATRGAPHLHRRADLPGLAAALWPTGDADATARIASDHIREGARLGVAAFTATAEAFHAVVTRPMPKGEVSAGVSALVPASLTYDCRPCRARHVSGAVFQQAALAGGVRLAQRGAGAALAPLDGWPGRPAAAVGTDRLIRHYLRLLGPATPADAARYLGTAAAHIAAVWPDGLVVVRVDGRRAWLPEEDVPALRAAPRPEYVRLLPPLDPLLQARDRDVLLPDRGLHQQVWRTLGNPGVLLTGGEIAGTWRAKLTGRRLDLTVSGFGPLPAAVRPAIGQEAQRLAAARGAADVRVIGADG